VALKQRVTASVVHQFGHPRGIAGQAAGWVMAHRRSNRQRNTWVVSLLDVQPTDRVLEVGFGPGLAISELARRVTEGCVYGIDHSDLMLHQATKRNATAIRASASNSFTRQSTSYPASTHRSTQSSPVSLNRPGIRGGSNS
jgi:SAM-dependent methyltransferase